MALYLSKAKTIRLAAYKNVKTTIKYVLTALPANTNPSYDVSAVDITDKYIDEMLGEDQCCPCQINTRGG